MAIHQRLKNWFRQKSRSRKNGQEETVAVPEVHTGKAKEKKISPLMYVLTVLFILKYVFL